MRTNPRPAAAVRSQRSERTGPDTPAHRGTRFEGFAQTATPTPAAGRSGPRDESPRSAGLPRVRTAPPAQRSRRGLDVRPPGAILLGPGHGSNHDIDDPTAALLCARRRTECLAGGYPLMTPNNASRRVGTAGTVAWRSAAHVARATVSASGRRTGHRTVRDDPLGPRDRPCPDQQVEIVEDWSG